jgi:hypothetical protein
MNDKDFVSSLLNELFDDFYNSGISFERSIFHEPG